MALGSGDREAQILLDLSRVSSSGSSTPSPSCCGYIFKQNDIAWTCITCQADSTCVLCNECFSKTGGKERHAGHDVKFHTTSGGGTCDCGDFEAWTRAPKNTEHNSRWYGGCDCHLCVPDDDEDDDADDSNNGGDKMVDENDANNTSDEVVSPFEDESVPQHIKDGLLGSFSEMLKLATTHSRGFDFDMAFNHNKYNHSQGEEVKSIDLNVFYVDLLRRSNKGSDKISSLLKQPPAHLGASLSAALSPNSLAMKRFGPDKRIRFREGFWKSTGKYREFLDSRSKTWLVSCFFDTPSEYFTVYDRLVGNITLPANLSSKTWADIDAKELGSVFGSLNSPSFDEPLKKLKKAAKELKAEGVTNILSVDRSDALGVKFLRLWFLWFEHVGFRCQVIPGNPFKDVSVSKAVQSISYLVKIALSGGLKGKALVRDLLLNPLHLRSASSLVGFKDPYNLFKIVTVDNSDLLHVLDTRTALSVDEGGISRYKSPASMSPSFLHPLNALISLLLLDVYIPLTYRKCIHELYLIFLTDGSFRAGLMEGLTVAYKPLATNYADAGHGGGAHDVDEEGEGAGILSKISVQIFTTSSLLKKIDNYCARVGKWEEGKERPFLLNLANIIMEEIYYNQLDACEQTALNSITTYGFDISSGTLPGEQPLYKSHLPRTYSDGFLTAKLTDQMRLWPLFRDLRYVLKTAGAAERNLRNRQVAKTWARLLRIGQNMDPQFRKTNGDAIEYPKDTWQESFELSLTLSSTNRAFVGLWEDELNDKVTYDGRLRAMDNLLTALMEEMRGELCREVDDLVNIWGNDEPSTIVVGERIASERVKINAGLNANAQLKDPERMVTAQAIQKRFSLQEILCRGNLKLRLSHLNLQPEEKKQLFDKMAVGDILDVCETVHDSYSGDPVSLHLPLHRSFVAGLLSLCKAPLPDGCGELYAFESPLTFFGRLGGAVDAIGEQTDRDRKVGAIKVLHSFSDFPLRTIVSAKQMNLKMWARNGDYQVLNQAINYFQPPLSLSLHDLDLHMCQFSASNAVEGLSPGNFFKTALLRFGLRLELSDFTKSALEATSKTPVVNDRQTKMVNEFFAFMCVVITELPAPPTALALEIAARREIVHKLAAATTTGCVHHELIEAVTKGVRDADNVGGLDKMIDSIIDDVATPIRRRDQVCFELNQTSSDEYDPVFWHLNNEEHQEAMSHVAQLRRKNNKKLSTVSPLCVALNRSHALFEPVKQLLFVDESFQAIRRALLMVVWRGLPSPPRVKSENLAEAISTSPVSFLEILQFSTLQLHTASACGSSAAFLDGILRTQETSGNVLNSHRSLADSSNEKDVIPLEFRSSVLGLFILLFKHWVKAENSSPSRDLVVMGLTWYLRAVSLSARGEDLSLARTGGCGGGGQGPTTTTVNEVVVDLLKTLDGLWPEPLSLASSSSASAMSSADRKSKMLEAKRKAAKERALKMMNNQQKLFADTVEDKSLLEEDDEECIICSSALCYVGGCAQDKYECPLGMIGHVQRNRVLGERIFREQGQAMENVALVVGERGCQLRRGSDEDSELGSKLEKGEVLEIVDYRGEGGVDGLLKTRRLRLKRKRKDGWREAKDADCEADSSQEEGWASCTSGGKLDGYQIVSLAKKHCWRKFGKGRPLVKMCGHKAHLPCVEQLCLSNMQKAASRFAMTGEHFSCNIEDGEFLCPLCKQISNCVVPRFQHWKYLEAEENVEAKENVEAEENMEAEEIVNVNANANASEVISDGGEAKKPDDMDTVAEDCKGEAAFNGKEKGREKDLYAWMDNFEKSQDSMLDILRADSKHINDVIKKSDNVKETDLLVLSVDSMPVKELKDHLSILAPHFLASLVPPINKEDLRKKVRAELVYRSHMRVLREEEREVTKFNLEMMYSMMPGWAQGGKGSEMYSEMYMGGNAEVMRSLHTMWAAVGYEASFKEASGRVYVGENTEAEGDADGEGMAALMRVAMSLYKCKLQETMKEMGFWEGEFGDFDSLNGRMKEGELLSLKARVIDLLRPGETETKKAEEAEEAEEGGNNDKKNAIVRRFAIMRDSVGRQDEVEKSLKEIRGEMEGEEKGIKSVFKEVNLLDQDLNCLCVGMCAIAIACSDVGLDEEKADAQDIKPVKQCDGDFFGALQLVAVLRLVKVLLNFCNNDVEGGTIFMDNTELMLVDQEDEDEDGDGDGEGDAMEEVRSV